MPVQCVRGAVPLAGLGRGGRHGSIAHTGRLVTVRTRPSCRGRAVSVLFERSDDFGRGELLCDLHGTAQRVSEPVRQSVRDEHRGARASRATHHTTDCCQSSQNMQGDEGTPGPQ